MRWSTRPYEVRAMRFGEPRVRPAIGIGPGAHPEAVRDLFADAARRVAAGPDGLALLELDWSPNPRARLLGFDPGEIDGWRITHPTVGLALVEAGSPPGAASTRASAERAYLTLGGAPASPGREESRETVRAEALRYDRAPGGEPRPPSPIGATPGISVTCQVHWAAAGGGLLWTAVRLRIVGEGTSAEVPRLAGRVLERLHALGLGVECRVLPSARGLDSEWRSGAWQRFRPRERFRTGPSLASDLALIGGWPAPWDPSEPLRHTVLFGASGSGKSGYLVHQARERLRAGTPLVLFDVHGDLGPRVVAELHPVEAHRVIAIDPTGPGPVPGLSLLGGTPPSQRDAERAHLLSALRRMGAEEGTPYWGFRLDRIFDTFILAVQDEGGDLRDLNDLLQDPARRELSRIRTSIPEVRRFLDELPAIVRRNPEFLWPAAARLSRLLLSPRLAALVAPDGPALPIEELLEGGRALVFRIPIGTFGPEGAHLVTTLLATRIYLGLVARAERTGGPVASTALFLDEAQAIAPRLLAEMLSEGRKFGLAVYLATQYPERLDPVARLAAAGSAGTHLIFRVPRAHAAALAPWTGLSEVDARQYLPTLPAGSALRTRSGPGGRLELVQVAPLPRPDPAAWQGLVAEASEEFGCGMDDRGAGSLPVGEERILLALLGDALEGRRTAVERLGPALAPSLDPATIATDLATLRRRGDVAGAPAEPEITLSGRYRLGFQPFTGASRESAEHRALLLEAFAVFARRGHRIEILRQGRFDTRLPDAWFRWFDGSLGGLAPRAVAERIAEARTRWAWRAFHGQDVFLEAEVTGAERSARIRHGLAKGRARGAFVLFLVSTPARARRVRRVLGEMQVGREEATVWTLRRAAWATTAPGAPFSPGGV
jgi:hypothetical protein